MGAVCSIEESSGPQNPRVPIVLKASKSAGAKGDVPKIYGGAPVPILCKLVLTYKVVHTCIKRVEIVLA